MGIYPDYKKTNYTCKKCNWTGLGALAVMGEEVDGQGFDLECPQCTDDSLDFIEFPLLETVAASGNKADKKKAQKILAKVSDRQQNELLHHAQLPDIFRPDLTFVLREEMVNGKMYIVIYQAGKEIWREEGYYEYYWRYLEIGEILITKYGKRIMDFVVDASSVYLGGDHLSAYDKVHQFRMDLKKNFVYGFPKK